ncbi:MAG TPA: hypothetical protein VFO52_02690 [Longimicrobiales bacterium]|nr:hypothetical protein [Longimicrobiales bacterium]
MSHTRKLFRAALPLAIVVVTACQDSSGPGSPAELNTSAVLADYNAMDAVRQSAGWQGFKLAAPQMAARMGFVRGDVAIGMIPLISDGNRGKTFVYDAVLHQWVIDAAATGAPANGVRFITYEPNGAEPDPSKPIGHADLIDLGDAAAGIALRLVVVEGTLTIVDYTTTLEGSAGAGHVTVDGFIQNTRDKLDFDIDVHGQNANGIERADIVFELGIAARQFRVIGDVEAEKQNGVERGAVDLSVRHGAHSFVVDIENQSGTLSGEIDLNSSPFALVSGPAQQPVFKRPNGSDIGGAEALVLWRIFDVTEDVFDLFEDLIDPIDELVIWAVIL